MKRKSLNRSNCRCRASEVNLHITQSSFALRQPWGLLVGFALLSAGRAVTFFFLCFMGAELDCLLPASIQQKGEKDRQ